jgi:hypothetical protein
MSYKIDLNPDERATLAAVRASLGMRSDAEVIRHLIRAAKMRLQVQPLREASA